MHGGGIRSLKQMYNILRSDEISKKNKRSESDSSSDEEIKSPIKNQDGGRNSAQSKPVDKDSGSDSDPQDGDLTVSKIKANYYRQKSRHECI